MDPGSAWSPAGNVLAKKVCREPLRLFFLLEHFWLCFCLSPHGIPVRMAWGWGRSCDTHPGSTPYQPPPPTLHLYPGNRCYSTSSGGAHGHPPGVEPGAGSLRASHTVMGPTLFPFPCSPLKSPPSPYWLFPLSPCQAEPGPARLLGKCPGFLAPGSGLSGPRSCPAPILTLHPLLMMLCGYFVP